MIAALQSSLSAKDMELEVHMKYILLKVYAKLLPQWAQRTCPNLWPLPHYAEEIWKRSFISTGLGLPSTLIHHDNGAFRHRCVLVWTEYILKTEVFENDDLASCFIQKSKMTGDCCVFSFLQRSVDGKHLMRFQISPA